MNYEYGELNQDGTVNTAKNTGNIAKTTTNFSGLSQPFVQSYRYDSLYRLTEARETKNGGQTWIQQFGYDRYGNRTSFYQNVGGLVINTTPAIDQNTNRFSDTNAFHFDKNGNLTQDIGQNNQARTVVFNADNRQREVKDANGYTIGTYFYDGEGHRIKKVTNTETMVYAYSNGRLIAEYSTAASPPNPSINFTTTDHLGSPRVITNELGQVKSRRDFLPFGEELTINVGARSTTLNYGSTDTVRQKFTGYQKDTETSLDFAEENMYENRFGRFTAVDPLLASGQSGSPQTFNRYVYVGNNPINLVDPLGLEWYTKKGSEESRPFWSETDPGEEYEKAPHVYWAGDEYGWVVLDYNSKHWESYFETREDAVMFYDRPSDYSLFDGVNEMMDGFDAVQLGTGTIRIGARHALKKVVMEGGELFLEKTTVKILRESAEKELAAAGKQITKIALNAYVGRAAERVAKEVLEKQGLEVIGSNVGIRTGQGRNGLRFVDPLVRTPSGEIVVDEIKSGGGYRLMAIEGKACCA